MEIQTDTGFPGGSVVKNPPTNAGDIGSILMSGRSPGEGNGNLLQYSCLKNPMDRGACTATVHGGCKELDMTVHTGIDRNQCRCELWNVWLITILYWKTTVCVVMWLIQDFPHVIWLKKRGNFLFFWDPFVLTSQEIKLIQTNGNDQIL